MGIFTDNKLYEVKEVHTINDRHSALRYAIHEFPHTKDSLTVGDVEKALIRDMDEFKSVNYIYFTNDDNQLTGVISIKELFRLPKDTLISEQMTKDIVSVRPTYTRERVTYVALRHKLKDVPVVDEDHKLLGIIPYDTIYSLAYKEAREDLMKLAGFHHDSAVTENIMEEPVLRAFKHRIPWLFLGLLGGLGAAGIIDAFETTLSKYLILASFIPLLVYMSDAIRTQMEAFVIRDLAINPKMNMKAYFIKQLLILMFIVSALAGSLYIISMVLYRSYYISATLSLALTGAALSSIITGVVLPGLFNRMKLDPANASGPIGTIAQDLLSVLIYFSVATLLL